MTKSLLQKRNFVWILVIVSLMTACKKENVNPVKAAKILPCAITSNTTLTDHNPDGVDYIVECRAEVMSGTLTIEPGVTLEFKVGAELYIKEKGALICVGIPTKPITMRGTLSQPSWSGVIVESINPLNELNYTTIENAGVSINFSRPAGLNRNQFAAAVGVYGRIKMQNTTISGSKGVGFICSGEATVDAFSANTIKGCAESPMVIYPPQCTNMTLNNCVFTGNNSNYIELYGTSSNESIDEPATIREATIPYLVTTSLICYSGLTIDAGVKLVVQASNNIQVYDDNAFIKANGTAAKPIVIQGEQPLKGLWGGLYISGNNIQNVMTNVYISEGGSQNYQFNNDMKGNILISDEGRLTLNNCRSTNFEGCGVYNNGGTLTNNSPEIPTSSVCKP
jgi:hypothetical protein